MKHLKILSLAFIFIISLKICFAEGTHIIRFHNQTNREISVQRLMNNDQCMKSDGSKKEFKIPAGAEDFWTVSDSNAVWSDFPTSCFNVTKKTTFLINHTDKIQWIHKSKSSENWMTEFVNPDGGDVNSNFSAQCGSPIINIDCQLNAADDNAYTNNDGVYKFNDADVFIKNTY